MVLPKTKLHGQDNSRGNAGDVGKVRRQRHGVFDAFRHKRRLIGRQKRQQDGDSPEHQWHAVESPSRECFGRASRQTAAYNGKDCRRRFLHTLKQTVDDVFAQRKDVVARPIKHQAASRIVEQHQEHCGHAVELHLVATRHVVRVNESACQIDDGHEYRQHVDGKRAETNHGVGLGQVGNAQKRHARQRLKVRQEVIRRKEERNLQEKAQRRAQRQKGRIARLPVHRRNHGKALLALEGALDHGFLGFKALTKRAFALLPLFGLDVDGQNHDVDGQTHHDDGWPPSLGVRITPDQGRMHPVFEWRNQKRVNEIQHRLRLLFGLRFAR